MKIKMSETLKEILRTFRSSDILEKLAILIDVLGVLIALIGTHKYVAILWLALIAKDFTIMLLHERIRIADELIKQSREMREPLLKLLQNLLNSKRKEDE